MTFAAPPTARDLIQQVVLIGPVCAGKSTIAPLIAERLGLPRVSLDPIASRYYEECGMGAAVLERITRERGFLAAYREWAPARARAVERFLSEHSTGVIDLGAGHTHFEDGELFARVKRALAPCANVVLLLPSPDLDESVRVLRQRSIAARGWDWIVDGHDFIERWVRDPCNGDLATMTVHTEGRAVEETGEEIVGRLRMRPGA